MTPGSPGPTCNEFRAPSNELARNRPGRPVGTPRQRDSGCSDSGCRDASDSGCSIASNTNKNNDLHDRLWPRLWPWRWPRGVRPILESGRSAPARPWDASVRRSGSCPVRPVSLPASSPFRPPAQGHRADRPRSVGGARRRDDRGATRRRRRSPRSAIFPRAGWSRSYWTTDRGRDTGGSRREDEFAAPTKRFHDLGGAVRCAVEDANIRLPVAVLDIMEAGADDAPR